MSRGLGKQQRRILEALKYQEAFYLMDLKPVDRADYVSLNRAMWKLADAGIIDVRAFRWGTKHEGKTIITRAGVIIDRLAFDRARWITKSINVERVVSGDSVNT